MGSFRFSHLPNFLEVDPVHSILGLLTLSSDSSRSKVRSLKERKNNNNETKYTTTYLRDPLVKIVLENLRTWTGPYVVEFKIMVVLGYNQ